MLGAGTVLDDASAQAVLPMVSADLLRGKSLIVTNFHVIESGEVPQVLFAPADGLDLDSGELAAASVLSTVPEKIWRSYWYRADLPMLVVSVWLRSLEIISVMMWKRLATPKARCGRIREAT